MKDEYFTKLGYRSMYMIISMAFALLGAFLVMWCWNYTIPHIFDLPTLTWGRAWCLYMLSQWLIKSTHIDIKKKGE